MIQFILGFILLILSTIVFSSIRFSDSRIFNIRRLAIISLAMVLAFAIQGFLGLMIFYHKTEIIYHTVYGFFSCLNY